jgi:acyl-coenzyme A thioesterase PaaI-like protein
MFTALSLFPLQTPLFPGGWLPLRIFGVRYLDMGLSQSEKLQFVSGAICGQVIMAVADTVASLANITSERMPKGTVYQHTHFLRPVATADMLVETNVLRFEKSSAFIEAKVSFLTTRELVTHSSPEFAF